MFWKFEKPDHYNLQCRLKGHTEAIYCVAVSRNGNLLASGGGDGIRLWDLRTFKAFDPQPQSRERQGQVSCTAWLTRRDDAQETLCCGTGLGFLKVWRQTSPAENFIETFDQRIGTGAEIVSMSTDASHDTDTRVALGTRDHVVQVFTADNKGILHSVFSIRLDTSIPIAVGFADNTAKDVYAFGLHNGQLHVLRGDNGQLQSTTTIGTLIGSAAINPTKNEFVVDSIANGFDLHHLDNGVWKRNYPTGKPERTRPKQVVFGEDGRIVVGGSDHGTVYVFDSQTASPLYILEHRGRMVQTLTTHKGSHSDLIVTASSSSCHEVSICVWEKKRPVVQVERTDHYAPTPLLEQICRVVVVFALIFLLCQESPRTSLAQWAGEAKNTLLGCIEGAHLAVNKVVANAGRK